MAEGKCFWCKEIGHLAPNCPKGTFVKSDKSGKAPGLPTYRIGLKINKAQELDWLWEAADNAPQLHQINFRAISFDPEEDWTNMEFPLVGDFVAEMAEQQLQHAQPYLWDDFSELIKSNEERFLMVQVPNEEKDVYEINNIKHDPCIEGFCIQIERETLFNPEFSLPLWYATQLAEKLQLDFDAMSQPQWFNYCMGDPYTCGLVCQLNAGKSLLPAKFNWEFEPNQWWLKIDAQEEDNYIIIDYGENIITRISCKHLKNPKFRIIRWYWKKIERSWKVWGVVHPTYLTSNEICEHHPIGDILAVSAEELLGKAVPYPGDKKQHNQPHWKAPCFKVTKVADSEYHKVHDLLCQTEAFVLTEHLQTPEFLLVKWCAEECESQDCSPPSNLPEQFSHLENGDSLVDGAAALLQGGGLYSGNEYHFVPERWFEVMLNPDEFFGKTYLVLDYMKVIAFHTIGHVLGSDFGCFLWSKISHMYLGDPIFVCARSEAKIHQDPALESFLQLSCRFTSLPT